MGAAFLRQLPQVQRLGINAIFVVAGRRIVAKIDRTGGLHASRYQQLAQAVELALQLVRPQRPVELGVHV